MKTIFNRKKLLFSKKARYQSIGYARQGHPKQISVDSQIQELKNAGCKIVFQEDVCSTWKEKPQLASAIATLKKGDEIVFTKLDRGFSNQKQCIQTIYHLQQKGIHVKTTDGRINTRALGKFSKQIISLLFELSEIERQIIIERTQESVEQRRKNGGNLGGRPRINSKKEDLVIRLRNQGCSYRLIRNQTGLALSTIRRIILEKEAEHD